MPTCQNLSNTGGVVVLSGRREEKHRLRLRATASIAVRADRIGDRISENGRRGVKRGPVHAAEALECLGGNGYIEDSGMLRLYREAPLMSIWEGSGNVAALDALRAMAK